MIKKKAQAALEFLTTYGWAFMLILIMIGALSYFGVLSPTKFLPERCTFPTEISCIDFQLDGSTYQVDLSLRQNVGKTIIIESVNCTYPDSAGTVASWNGAGAAWSPKQTITASCVPGAGSGLLVSGEKQKVEFLLTYKLDSGGYNHYAEGEVFASVK